MDTNVRHRWKKWVLLNWKKILHFLHYDEPTLLKTRHSLCTCFPLNCTKFRQVSISCLQRQLHNFWVADSKERFSTKLQGTTSSWHRLLELENWKKNFDLKINGPEK